MLFLVFRFVNGKLFIFLHCKHMMHHLVTIFQLYILFNRINFKEKKLYSRFAIAKKM